MVALISNMLSKKKLFFIKEIENKIAFCCTFKSVTGSHGKKGTVCQTRNLHLHCFINHNKVY